MCVSWKRKVGSITIALLASLVSISCGRNAKPTQQGLGVTEANTKREIEESSEEKPVNLASESSTTLLTSEKNLLEVGDTLRFGGYSLQVRSKLELASSCLREGLELYKCEDFTHLDSFWRSVVVRRPMGAEEGRGTVDSIAPPWRVAVGGPNEGLEVIVDAIVSSVTDLWPHVASVPSAKHALSLVDVVPFLGERSRRIDESKLLDESLSGLASVLHPSKIRAVDDDSTFILELNYAMVPRTGVPHDSFSAFYRVRIQITTTAGFRVTGIDPYLDSIDKVDLGWILD